MPWRLSRVRCLGEWEGFFFVELVVRLSHRGPKEMVNMAGISGYSFWKVVYKNTKKGIGMVVRWTSVCRRILTRLVVFPKVSIQSALLKGFETLQNGFQKDGRRKEEKDKTRQQNKTKD